MAVTHPSEPIRSRRAVIRAGLAGVAGLALGALARPHATEAAAGSPVVMGQSNSAGTSNTTLSTSSTGTALQVTQSGTGTALRGTANNGIAGFFTSGSGSGISGVVGANTKYGVYGANDATTYAGGAAVRANGKSNHGVVATTTSPSAFAVQAQNTSTSGVAIDAKAEVAVQGLATAAGGCGVAGSVNQATGSDVGVFGLTMSTSGRGVFGVSDPGSGVTCGVEGQCNSADDAAAGVVGVGPMNGVYGIASVDFGAGVYGVAGGTAVHYGVYGSADPTGYGVYSDGDGYVFGDLEVSGTLSKGGGSFKIDHPLDPANKFLYHSFVESPDMKNVYDGVVTLDAKGEATVTLPDWFEALNRDFRYQLTPIDRFAPLFVKSRLEGGRFTIAGGEPNQEICWMLTGIRRDAFANAHRIPVEETKPAAERGLFLHPVEHGQPKTKAIGASQRRTVTARPAAPDVVTRARSRAGR